MNQLHRLCVFCGSNAGVRDGYVRAARDVGRVLVKQDIGLVYGASSMGLMAQVAYAVLGNGGRVTGVIPRHLLAREVPPQRLADLRVVGTMHERKALMFDLSDGFVALPGGYGTLEELAEILTWLQLGLHTKPVGLLNVSGYFSGLVSFFDHAVEEGFIDSEHRRLLLVDEDFERLLGRFRRFEPPVTEQWLADDGR